MYWLISQNGFVSKAALVAKTRNEYRFKDVAPPPRGRIHHLQWSEGHELFRKVCLTSKWKNDDLYIKVVGPKIKIAQKRNYIRYEVNERGLISQGSFAIQGGCQVSIQDLSAGGLSFRSKQIFKLNETIRISFNLEGLGEISALGHIVRVPSTVDAWALPYSARFVRLPRKMQKRLDKHLQINHKELTR